MLFNDQEEYCQAIANELVEIIKEPWASAEVEAELFDDSIDLKVVYISANGARESDVNLIMLPEYFYELARVVSNEEKGLYKRCIFTLKSNGVFDVNFEY